ncbi:uncharacterized protein LOC112138307 isoform X2 [Oryzias melastigma]|uniref:uncharacterized protein LOC112138307 isoform X2 n=1 Tax=Oryzias melastigma TaxID=30732 RepID=UPI000CF808A6|nr:uncharacterized protein LOC112138307 isoform X2 [Oryzias melastigma]
MATSSSAGSAASEEATQENSINIVINRVWNALNMARQELSVHRDDDNLLRSTRRSFRRRRRQLSDRDGASNRTWKVRLFLLAKSDQQSIPSPTECCELIRHGLGSQTEELTRGPEDFPKLSWTALQLKNYICQKYTKVNLHLIGFDLARADKNKHLYKITGNTVADLRKELGRSRLYVIPHSDISLPSTSLATATSTAEPTPMNEEAPQHYEAVLTTQNESSNSLAETLDPEEWQNAGTPEVYYRRRHLDPTVEDINRSSMDHFLIADDSDEEEDRDIVPHDLASDDPFSDEMDIVTIMKMFREKHLTDGQNLSVIIRRRKLLESAVKAIKRPTFIWTTTPHIEFVGEEADDLGGPQREFFRLLMKEVQGSFGIFEGKPGQVLMTYDQAALEQQKYFLGGNLVAWSVVHGGPSIKCLDPTLFQLMCGQEPRLEEFDWSVIPDVEIQSKLQKIQECKTSADLTSIKQTLGDWIADCGIPQIFSASVDDIPKIYGNVVKHCIFLRTSKPIQQFTEGMNAFGNLSRGSNQREAEEETIYCWEQVLNMIEDKSSDLSYEDLLIFITGADEVPTLGFTSKPSVDFYTQEDGQRRLPYSSTCAMVLFLPRGVTEEGELHDMLCQCVRECIGFGKV